MHRIGPTGNISDAVRVSLPYGLPCPLRAGLFWKRSKPHGTGCTSPFPAPTSLHATPKRSLCPALLVFTVNFPHRWHLLAGTLACKAPIVLACKAPIFSRWRACGAVYLLRRSFSVKRVPSFCVTTLYCCILRFRLLPCAGLPPQRNQIRQHRLDPHQS